MSGLETNSKNNNSNKITNIIRSPPISSKPLPPTPQKQQSPIELTQPLPQSSITRSNLISIANRDRDPTSERAYIKNKNRHTIAISANEDYENVYSNIPSAAIIDSNLDDDKYFSKKSSIIKSEQKQSST
jgi:hypothetical protein